MEFDEKNVVINQKIGVWDLSQPPDSFTLSLIKHLLNSYCVPDPVRGTGATSVIKVDTVCAHIKHTCYKLLAAAMECEEEPHGDESSHDLDFGMWGGVGSRKAIYQQLHLNREQKDDNY